MLYYEQKYKEQGKQFVIGVDEAGRGPLAGPVVAAAVLLKKTDFNNRIDDSKKLSPAQRIKAFPEIIENSFFGIGIINEKIIDRLNILVATQLAMEDAIEVLIHRLKPQQNNNIHVLVDGLVKLKIDFSYTNIIRGDGKSLSIAAASIIAKVTRDRIMDVYDKVYPQYGFMRHKGYGTLFHRQALKNYGKSLIHRDTFIH